MKELDISRGNSAAQTLSSLDSQVELLGKSKCSDCSWIRELYSKGALADQDSDCGHCYLIKKPCHGCPTSSVGEAIKKVYSKTI